MINKIIFKNIKFNNLDHQKFDKIISKKGLFVFPSGPALAGSIAPHMSGKALARLVEDTLQLQRFDLFTDNAAVFEGAETQRLVNQVQEDLAMEAEAPIEDGAAGPVPPEEGE